MTTKAPNHDAIVAFLRQEIAGGKDAALRETLTKWENTLWAMRVSGQFDVALAHKAESFISALREVFDLPPFPDVAPSAFEDTVLMQALAHGYDPDGPRMGQPKPARERLTCRRCGQDGYAGAYPFSTAPRSGYCDDCF